MKKWILLIGLLTYSSVGWSKTLIMECFLEVPKMVQELNLGLGKRKSMGILRLETDEDESSNELLSVREDGVWKGNCNDPKMICEKGDQSVVVYQSINGKETKSVFDFRFLNVKTTTYIVDQDTPEKTKVSEMTCEKIK